MSTCKSSSSDTLNAMIPADNCGEGHTVTLKYGPYMNCGRWNHNTSRINPLIHQLNALGFNVQLQHDAKETSWEEHGYVTLCYTPKATGKEVTLCHADRVQHNRGYSTRQADMAQLVATAKKVMDGLTSAKGTSILAKAATTAATTATTSASASSSDKATATTTATATTSDGKADAAALSLEAKM